ncbi:MAG: hypothetical protein ABEJ02_01085 [Candidatus Paceibacteria bacterium]
MLQVTNKEQVIRVKNGTLYDVKLINGREEKSLIEKGVDAGAKVAVFLVVFLFFLSIEYLFSGIMTKTLLNAITIGSALGVMKVLKDRRKKEIKKKYWQGNPTMVVSETGEELMRIDEPPSPRGPLMPAERRIERLKEVQKVLERELRKPKGLKEDRKKVRTSLRMIKRRIEEIRNKNIYTEGQDGVLDEC